MLKQVLVLFLLVTAIVAETAYFAFTTHGDRNVEFVIELTSDTLIKHARELINGDTTDQPHIAGRILKRPQPYNPRYSFHIAPDTISFFNHAIEVCDSSFTYAEDHLDEACGPFLPGCVICPWTSKIVKEVDSSFVNNYQASFRTGGRYLYQKEDYY